MKTLILALDGLEHSLIDRLGLTKFKQKYSGTYSLDMLEITTTPICFSAILTGKDPRTYGYTLDFVKKGKTTTYVSWMKPLYLLRKAIFGTKNLGLRTKAASMNLIVPHTERNIMTEQMKQYTILNRLESEGYVIKTDNVPSYDTITDENSDSNLIDYLGKDFSIRENLIRGIMTSISERWLENIKALDDHDLIFMYSILPDKAHHLIHHKKEVLLLKEVYQHLYNLPFLFELKNIAVLILSDHGYLNVFNEETGKEIEGTHSSQGFWSLNLDTKNKPTDVFGFYSLIYELVTM